jgi:hypothetical protein
LSGGKLTKSVRGGAFSACSPNRPCRWGNVNTVKACKLQIDSDIPTFHPAKALETRPERREAQSHFGIGFG